MCLLETILTVEYFRNTHPSQVSVRDLLQHHSSDVLWRVYKLYGRVLLPAGGSDHRGRKLYPGLLLPHRLHQQHGRNLSHGPGVPWGQRPAKVLRPRLFHQPDRTVAVQHLSQWVRLRMILNPTIQSLPYVCVIIWTCLTFGPGSTVCQRMSLRVSPPLVILTVQQATTAPVEQVSTGNIVPRAPTASRPTCSRWVVWSTTLTCPEIYEIDLKLIHLVKFWLSCVTYWNW